MKKTSLNCYLLLSLLCCLLYLPGIVHVPMMDRDSAHFAQATRQMLQTNQYFQIRFQEKTRYQKPPGVNWLQAAAVSVFSDADASQAWPYRVPSFLGGLFSVLLLFGLSKRWVGKSTALLASALLAISLLLVVESHLAVIDASLLSAVMLMQGALWRIYMDFHEKGRRSHWGWALAFWVAMSYGFVLKGVTPLVGFLTIITLSIVDKNIRWLKGVRFSWGLVLFILSMGWLLLVNEAEQSNYLLKMVQKDLLPKLKGGHESHGQPPLFHLAILPLTFWPGSLFLWIAAVRGWQQKRAIIERFLLAWIVPTWVFFELMPTKLPQYVLPTFPAIALLAALAIYHWRALAVCGGHLRWLKILIALWLVFSIAFAGVFVMLSYYVIGYASYASIIACIAIAVSAMMAAIWAWQTQFKQATWAIIFGAVIAYAAIYQGVLPSLQPLWLSKRIVSTLGKSRLTTLTAESPLLAIGYEEPSLVFNLNTTQVKFTNLTTAIEQIKQKRASFVVVDDRQLAPLLKLAHKQGLTLCQFSQVDGINYSKGKLVSLRLLELRDDNHC